MLKRHPKRKGEPAGSELTQLCTTELRQDDFLGQEYCNIKQLTLHVTFNNFWFRQSFSKKATL